MNFEEEFTEKEDPKQESVVLIPSPKETSIKTITLVADISEEISREMISSLLYLYETSKKEEQDDIDPIQIYISTNGGNADDMFAIYDVMRIVRKEIAIETVGIGKVMSAGALLLAAGTKGKRKIGRHCRVMIHSVIGGHIGPMHMLNSEIKAVKDLQADYIKALSRETNLSVQAIRKILNKKVNVYLTAEQAVEYGLADEIF